MPSITERRDIFDNANDKRKRQAVEVLQGIINLVERDGVEFFSVKATDGNINDILRGEGEDAKILQEITKVEFELTTLHPQHRKETS